MSKAIDKAAGVEREVVEHRTDGPSSWLLEQKIEHRASGGTGIGYADGSGKEYDVTAPASDAAKKWQGWGTALKPAFEPIVVARKPLIGTVAANVLGHGTGALNIDGCRVGSEQLVNPAAGNKPGGASLNMSQYGMPDGVEAREATGRWPANVVLGHHEDCVQVGTKRVKGTGGAYPQTIRAGGYEGWTKGVERDTRVEIADADGLETVEAWECHPGCPVRLLDEQSGEKSSHASERDVTESSTNTYGWAKGGIWKSGIHFGDSGGASRFFYTAKVSRAERNAGLDGFEVQAAGGMAGRHDGSFDGHITMARNVHPTVKPIDLMRWLIRLVTPPGGTCLDPFLGSGSTGCAAVLEGFDFVGVEREPEYMEIAEARIGFWSEHGEDGLRIVREREQGAREREEREAAGQMGLFG